MENTEKSTVTVSLNKDGQLPALPGEVTREQADALREAIRNRSDVVEPSMMLKLYERTGTNWLISFAVLGTSMTLGALRAHMLGSSPFSFQFATTLVLLCTLPVGVRLHVREYVSTPVAVACATAWLALSGGPVMVAFVLELFTGHRRAGMAWWEGIWRVYAVLGLWIWLAYCIENFIRPWWRDMSARMVSRGTGGTPSVALQAERIAMGRRTARLESIKARVVVLVRRKKRIAAQLQRMQDEDLMAGVRDQLEDVEDQLRLAQLEWTEALNVDNHRQFSVRGWHVCTNTSSSLSSLYRLDTVQRYRG